MGFFDAHDEGCKPREPCPKCKIARFIESELPYEKKSFFELSESISSYKEHLPGCSPIAQCEVCESLQLLREAGSSGRHRRNLLGVFLSIIDRPEQYAPGEITEDTPVSRIGIMGRLHAILLEKGIETVGGLTTLTEEEFLMTIQSGSGESFSFTAFLYTCYLTNIYKVR